MDKMTKKLKDVYIYICCEEVEVHSSFLEVNKFIYLYIKVFWKGFASTNTVGEVLVKFSV